MLFTRCGAAKDLRASLVPIGNSVSILSSTSRPGDQVLGIL